MGRQLPAEAERPLEEQREEHEGDAESEGVGQRQHPAAHGRPVSPAVEGERDDRRVGRADAGGPAQPEHDPHQRGAEQAGVGLLRGDRLRGGQARERPHEHQAHEDHDRAGDAVDPHGMLLQEIADGAGEAAEHHEHQREPGDEQQGSGEHPAGSGTGGAGGAPAGALRRRRGGALPGQARDVAEIAGHDGQHARREEGDDPGRGGDGDRQQQRSGQRGRLEGVPDLGEAHSATTASIIARSTDGSAAPEMRAATRPSRSSTSVEGTAFGETCPRRAYMISAPVSGREG